MLIQTVSKIARDSKDQILKSLGGKPVEPEELRSLLKLKADKEDITKIDHVKADKSDFEVNNSILEVMHSQINHIWLILWEYFKFESENVNKPDNLVKDKIT